MKPEDVLKQVIEDLTKEPVSKRTRESWDWDEKDILMMISNKVRENINLDYKATASLGKSDAKRKEISKDVSAFANSAGGTIVYGVSENGDHEPEKIDGGYDISDISGEWLEQVINSNIQPKIQGIRINQIDLSTVAPGRVIYTVYIPQSITVHQASDKRYYKRYNFESIPMEDWEIKDILNRGICPDLKIIIEGDKGEKAAVAFKEGENLSEPIKIDVIIRNDGNGVAEYSVVNLVVPSQLQLSIPGFTSKVVDQNQTRFSINLSVPGHMPIFKKTGPWLIGTGAIRLPKNLPPFPYVITWNVAAPQMEEKAGLFLLEVKGDVLNITELTMQGLASMFKKLGVINNKGTQKQA